MQKKNLWVVEFRPGQSGIVPEPRFWPDFEKEGIEVIVADQFFAVVVAEYDHLNRIIASPYLKIAGHPADGRWIGEGGETVYIIDGRVVDDEWEAWDALGLRPETFGAETWHDVDDDIVRAHISTF